MGGPCRPQKGQAGIRGSTPPGKLGFPSPALLTCPWRAGSSPPRCGWTASCAWPSRVRDAGSLARGAGRQVPVQRSAGGQASAGLGAGGGRAPRGRGGKRGGGGISSTSFTPAPAPRAGGTQRPGGPIGRRGSPGWAGLARAAAPIGHRERCEGGACSWRRRAMVGPGSREKAEG